MFVVCDFFNTKVFFGVCSLQWFERQESQLHELLICDHVGHLHHFHPPKQHGWQKFTCLTRKFRTVELQFNLPERDFRPSETSLQWTARARTVVGRWTTWGWTCPAQLHSFRAGTRLARVPSSIRTVEIHSHTLRNVQLQIRAQNTNTAKESGKVFCRQSVCRAFSFAYAQPKQCFHDVDSFKNLCEELFDTVCWNKTRQQICTVHVQVLPNAHPRWDFFLRKATLVPQ